MTDPVVCSLHGDAPSMTCDECLEIGRRLTPIREAEERAQARRGRLVSRIEELGARHDAFLEHAGAFIGSVLVLPMIVWIWWLFTLINRNFDDGVTRWLLQSVGVCVPFLVMCWFLRHLYRR